MADSEMSIRQNENSDPRSAQGKPGSPSSNNSHKEIAPGLLLLEEELASNSDGANAAIEYNGPDVDLVHVAAICPDDKLHNISTLVGNLRSDKRAVLFRLDLGSLLVGELIQDVVEERAWRLLDALASIQARESRERRRAIVFVAYDLGDLVVKTALFFAARSFPDHAYQDVFNNTTCTLFSGCFHRTLNTKELQSKLFDLLRDSGCNTSRPLLITSLRHITQAVLDATNLFKSSKISLRSQVISLFANGKGSGLLHASFECFVATLGFLDEATMEEEEEEGTDIKDRFPLLLRSITNCLRESPRIKEPHVTHFEASLLSRSSPDAQFSTWPQSSPITHPVMSQSTYKLWAETNGFQTLYLYGSSYFSTHDAADYIFLAWKLRRHSFGCPPALKPMALSFTFDSNDPVRNSLADMFASVILQAIRCSRWKFEGLYPFYPRECGGWTERSRITAFEIFRQRIVAFDTLLMLHDFDECPRESRRLFYSFYKSVFEGCEQRLKVIITSRLSGILAAEAQLAIDMDEGINLAAVNLNAHIDGDEQESGLGYMSTWGRRLQQAIRELESTETKINHLSVDLIIEYAALDREPSMQRLDTCIHLVKSLNPSTSPSQTLDQILRLDADQNGLRWILTWLMCGYRPLSLWELATTLRDYRGKASSVSRHLSQPTATRLIATELTSRLHFLIDLTNNGVTMRKDIRAFLQPDTQADRFIWNEVAPTGHAEILEYCFLQLCTPEAHEFLEDIHLRYEQYINKQRSLQQIASPVLPDGRNILFYVVQSLPYHLAECPSKGTGEKYLSRLTNECDPNSATFSLWAKANWAMSNPFSRTAVSPTSTLAVLSGIGKLPIENVKDKGNDIFQQCLLAAVSSSKETWLMAEDVPLPTLREALLEAIKADNEAFALSICNRISLLYKADTVNLQWPSSILWASTWLKMDHLTQALFAHGVPETVAPDIWGLRPILKRPYELYTSLLVLASVIGNTQVIRHLFKEKSEFYTTTEGLDELSCALDTAAACGQTTVIQEIIQRFPMVLEKSVERSLLLPAGSHGHLEATSFLLGLKLESDAFMQVVQGNESSKWRTLLWASGNGFLGVVGALLEAGVQPNSQPPTKDSPLRLAVRNGPHLSCIRKLLEHGADPNHDENEEPLGREVLYRNTKMVEPEKLITTLDLLVGGTKPLQLDRGRTSDGSTALMFAVWARVTPVVRWLLDQGVDVNIRDQLGNDALCWAIRGGSLEVVKQVFTANPKLDTLIEYQDESYRLGELALDHMDIFNYLLAHGLDPELADTYGYTLLIAAVKERNVVALRNLLERGVNMEARDRWGDTAIANAIYWDAPTELRMLAEAGANMWTVNDDGEGLLHLAIGSTAEVMKTVLEFRKRVDLEHRDKRSRTPLLSFTRDTDVECVKLLINAGADINAQDNDGDTALIHALTYNMPKIVDLLLAQPELDVKNVSDRHPSPLTVACAYSRLDYIIPLLRCGANANHYRVNSTRSTPLISACGPFTESYSRQDHDQKVAEIVQILVDHGADINTNVVDGWTFHNCLSAAAFAAGTATVQFLIEKGASPNSANPATGRLPIHFAAANGIENFQAILPFFEGDLMATDLEGKTSLHWAAQFGLVKTVELILSMPGGDLEMKKRYLSLADSDGWSALCWAVRPYDEEEDDFGGIGWSEPVDRISTIKALLRHGADRNVKCQVSSGDALELLTPLELARRYNTSKETLRMLKFGLLTTDQAERPGLSCQEANVELDLAHQYIVRTPFFCDVCQGRIYGRSYRCTTCTDYDVCNKCIRTVATFHSAKTQTDGESHVMELHPDYKEDFQPLDSMSQLGDGGFTVDQTDSNLSAAKDVEDDEEMEIEVDDESMLE